MTNCNICGQPMIQLCGWDFKQDVCLNHEPTAHFINHNWGEEITYEDRALYPDEISLIENRATTLQRRLNVVKNPKEIWTVVLSFLDGSWSPEIDERITMKKGEHL